MSKYAKAYAAAVVAGQASLTIAGTDGKITGLEWAMIASATLVAFTITWAVPNADAAVLPPLV